MRAAWRRDPQDYNSYLAGPVRSGPVQSSPVGVGYRLFLRAGGVAQGPSGLQQLPGRSSPVRSSPVQSSWCWLQVISACGRRGAGTLRTTTATWPVQSGPVQSSPVQLVLVTGYFCVRTAWRRDPQDYNSYLAGPVRSGPVQSSPVGVGYRLFLRAGGVAQGPSGLQQLPGRSSPVRSGPVQSSPVGVGYRLFLRAGGMAQGPSGLQQLPGRGVPLSCQHDWGAVSAGVILPRGVTAAPGLYRGPLLSERR